MTKRYLAIVFFLIGLSLVELGCNNDRSSPTETVSDVVGFDGVDFWMAPGNTLAPDTVSIRDIKVSVSPTYEVKQITQQQFHSPYSAFAIVLIRIRVIWEVDSINIYDVLSEDSTTSIHRNFLIKSRNSDLFEVTAASVNNAVKLGPSSLDFKFKSIIPQKTDVLRQLKFKFFGRNGKTLVAKSRPIYLKE